ncbi:MAG: right-handed parallel beta-helix repeat-containing protein [Deltaproteobacteria bacterium]|nr:right-handed parallel beta-helix repeat-containing protein [Deltaproteobacteria bacterium]
MKIKTNHISILFLSICFLGLIGATPVWSTTYYVDINNGTDTPTSGISADDAWKTLHYAIPLLQAGDILNVATGTYSVAKGEEDKALTVTQNNLTIQGTTGTVIDGDPGCLSEWGPAFNISASGVTIKHMEITGFTCDALGQNMVVSAGSNNRIDSCDISDSGVGILLTSGSGSGNVVENCSIYNHYSRGIEIEGSAPQILDNTIYENGTNIHIAESSGQTIQPVIVNNLIYAKSSIPGTGIEIYAFSTGSTVAAQIYHNTLVGSGQALSKGIYVSEESPGIPGGLKIKYNIITGFETGIKDDFQASGILDFDYNNVVNNTTDYIGVVEGTNDVSIDPLFVDSGNLDFHLGPTSPLLNLIRASAGDTVAGDLDGVARPKGLGREMGCYEISGTRALWVYNVGSSHRRIVLPDINNDGFDELVVHENAISDSIDSYVYAVSGADGATILWTYTLNSLQRGLAVLDDLDNDGIQDILVMIGTSDRLNNMGDDAMYVLSGAENPTTRVIWGPVGHLGDSTLGCGLYQPLIVPDVDGDGINDIFANVSVRLACYGSDAGLLFSGVDGSRIWFFTDANLWDVYGRTAAPDFNEDSLADIIVSGASTEDVGGVQAWAGGGASPIQIWSVLTTENITNPAVVGDANLDGVPDIAVGKFHTGTCPTTPDPRLYILSGSSGSILWQYPLDRTPSGIESLGDVNGDTIEDVVIGTAGTCGGSDSSVYAFDGFAGADDRLLWSYVLTDQDSYVKVVPDTNGDGKKDVIVSGKSDKLVLLSGVDGSLLSQESFPNGSGTVQPGEFNNKVGGDMLSNWGNSIFALSFPPSGTPQNSMPVTPVPKTPSDEAIIDEGTAVTLQASDFSDPDGDAHNTSYWEVERFDSEELLPSYFDAPSVVGLTSHAVMDTLDPGLKYAWRVKYEDERGAVSEWSTMSTFKVGTPVPESLPAVQAGKELGDFGMISIVHWPDNPAPQAVFSIDYNPANYRIGTWDPEQGRYIEFGDGLEMEPGTAYWILAREGLVVNFNGIPVSKIHDLEHCLYINATSGYGWNMIAPPNDADYLWNEVKVGRWVEGKPELTVAPVHILDPAAATLIDQQRIWQWEGGTYQAYTPSDNFTLQSYSGYWVKANLEGSYLVFPEYAQVAGLSTPGNTMLAIKGKAVQWLKKLMPNAREAIADNDSPPMPMGTFNDQVDPLFEGCFVETLER